MNSLSIQEREVLLGVIAGNSLREIVASLNMTGLRAEAIRAQILDKFGVATTADLVRIGIYAGLN